MRLKPNEAEVLNKLLKMYEESGNPVRVSSRDIDVMFWQAMIRKSYIKFFPTRQSKLGILRRLKNKGIISVDYEDKFNPMITINNPDEAKQHLLDTPVPNEERILDKE